MDSIIDAIHNENIDEINALIHNSNKDIKNKRDILYEIYDKNELSESRLKFIIENCSKYINISSPLIKRLIKEDNFPLFSIIFENLYFFDNEFILNFLLLNYKNKTPISTSDLKQQISKYKYHKPDKCLYKICNDFLYNACETGNENMFFFLIRHGADINIEDEYQTPLSEACRGGNVNIVNYLVEHGADINKEIFYGETPLFSACDNGNENIIKYLVEHGADISKENRDGETPLFYACYNGHENIVKYLVEHGANINKENLEKKRPLSIVKEERYENIIKYLEENGAKESIAQNI